MVGGGESAFDWICIIIPDGITEGWHRCLTRMRPCRRAQQHGRTVQRVHASGPPWAAAKDRQRAHCRPYKSPGWRMLSANATCCFSGGTHDEASIHQQLNPCLPVSLSHTHRHTHKRKHSLFHSIERDQKKSAMSQHATQLINLSTECSIPHGTGFLFTQCRTGQTERRSFGSFFLQMWQSVF